MPHSVKRPRRNMTPAPMSQFQQYHLNYMAEQLFDTEIMGPSISHIEAAVEPIPEVGPSSKLKR